MPLCVTVKMASLASVVRLTVMNVNPIHASKAREHAKSVILKVIIQQSLSSSDSESTHTNPLCANWVVKSYTDNKNFVPSDMHATLVSHHMVLLTLMWEGGMYSVKPRLSTQGQVK